MSAKKCAISGLPISHGDRVIYFLVSEYPYNLQDTHSASNQNGHWVPRTPPVRGVYTGGQCPVTVDELDGFTSALWKTALDVDALRCGPGEDPYSEPPVEPGMPLESYEEAICHHTLKVDREVMSRRADKDSDDMDRDIAAMMPRIREELGEDPQPSAVEFKSRQVRLGERQHPRGVPSIDKVVRMLTDSGQHVYQNETGEDWGYLVDSPYSPLHVRIRWSDRNIPAGIKPGTHRDRAHAALIALNTYASGERFTTALTAGMERHGGQRPEIQVYPNLSQVPNDWGGPNPNYNTAPLRISHVLILESVWDAIVNVDPQTMSKEWEDKFHTSAEYLATLTDYYDSTLEAFQKHQSNLGMRDRMRNFWVLGHLPPDRKEQTTAKSWEYVSSWNSGSKFPVYFIGQVFHWQLAVERGLPSADPQVARYIRNQAEFAYVAERLDALEFKWEPSTYAREYMPLQPFLTFQTLMLGETARLKIAQDTRRAAFEDEDAESELTERED